MVSSQERLQSYREVRNQLGGLGETLLRTLVERGDLGPKLKIGGRVMLRASCVQAYIERLTEQAS